MLLIDLNQVMIANIMQNIHASPNLELDENLVRHMILNSLRSYIKQFKENYGEIVICCEGSKSWRKQLFPFYKANRKKDQQNSKVDWNIIFQTLNKMRAELKEFFPYIVVEADRAEADDIIACLTERNKNIEDTLIISSDKDFIQLQKFGNVKQYSPILSKFISTEDPELFIREHILKGDRVDGIPNFLSDDDTFVNNKRQKTLSKKNLSIWTKQTPKEFCTTNESQRGYNRNRTLIDFTLIPSAIKTDVLEAYEKEKENKKGKKMMNLLDYFTEKRLSKLIYQIHDFY